jgi:hypothetical protein
MLPKRRYQYIAAIYAAGLTHPDMATVLQPEKVGFQPYITSEVWERLKAAMRAYRDLSAQHADTKPVEAAILFYSGWLGHYVGDGSQPLHTTINYNGWVLKDNPNGYTTEHTIHSKFETTFVGANITPAEVQPLVSALQPVNDEWSDYLAYLHQSNSLVERVYQLDKQKGFDGAGTPEGKQFTEQRLAAGASMLRDLIYAAWVQSVQPHDRPAMPTGYPAKPASGLAALRGCSLPALHLKDLWRPGVSLDDMSFDYGLQILPVPVLGSLGEHRV